MDGQHREHGQTYAYSSPEWPEIYDLWVQRLFGNGAAEDVKIFQDELQSLMNAMPPDQEMMVVDLGTGTGRLTRYLHPTIFLHSLALRVDLIGIDHSEAMLERAQKKFEEDWVKHEAVVKWPQWILASATNFVDKAPQLAHQTGMLIFAAGGLSHLTADGEIDVFLQQVKLALREDERSVAIVSVLHEFLDKAGLNAQEDRLEEGEEITLASKDHRGVFYIKSPTTSTYNGRIRIDRFSMKARKIGEPNSGALVAESTVLWHKEMAWSMRSFNDGMLKMAIERAGLKVESVKEGSIQRWYFIKNAHL